MPKTNEPIDDFLSQVNSKENPNDFIKDESDPLELDSKEPKTAVVEDSQDNQSDSDEGKTVAFHKDPKVLRFIEKEVGKRMKNFTPSPTQSPASQSDSFSEELTATLTKIIGNDTPERVSAIKELHTHLLKIEERGASRARQQIVEEQAQEQQQEEQAYDYLQNAFEEIEDQHDVDFSSNTQGRKLRSEFVDFIARISPKDEEGNIKDYPDIQEAWALFSANRKPADTSRAKDISARSMARSSETNSTAPRGNTWKDVEKAFSKLS